MAAGHRPWQTPAKLAESTLQTANQKTQRPINQ